MEEQREVAREALEAGLRAGQNPRETALGIVGRVNKATGRREGGTLGLTAQMEGYVATARAELRSGDPDRLQHYLTRGRRDARFDGAVRKALKDGKPVPAAEVERMVGRYSDRLLKLRGDTIARTESIAALGAARHEAFRQALERSNYGTHQVVRTWQSASDARVRHSHIAMNGQKVRGMDVPFVTPAGATMRWPGDAEMGAGPEETINCRCIELIEIDVFGE